MGLTEGSCSAKVRSPAFRPRPFWPTRSLELHIVATCLVVFAWQVEPSHPLVVAPNRDEHFDRPAGLFCVLQESGPGCSVGETSPPGHPVSSERARGGGRTHQPSLSQRARSNQAIPGANYHYCSPSIAASRPSWPTRWNVSIRATTTRRGYFRYALTTIGLSRTNHGRRCRSGAVRSLVTQHDEYDAGIRLLRYNF